MKKSIILSLTILGIVLSIKTMAQPNTNVSGFNSIETDGPFNLMIKIDGTESLKLDVDDDLVKNIQISVVNEKLNIRLKKNLSPSYHINKANIYISAKSLEFIENAGSGNVELESGIDAKELKLVLSGSGYVKTAVKTANLVAKLTGSGSLFISGTADNANLRLTGSGQIMGKELAAKSVSAAITGSGNIFVGANESISGNITASGNVVYSGKAVVTGSHYTSSGRIVQKQ